MNDQFARIPVNNIITSEYKSIGRLEWWDWWFPHPDFDPVNNGRVHLFGKLYFRVSNNK